MRITFNIVLDIEETGTPVVTVSKRPNKHSVEISVASDKENQESTEVEEAEEPLQEDTASDTMPSLSEQIRESAQKKLLIEEVSEYIVKRGEVTLDQLRLAFPGALANSVRSAVGNLKSKGYVANHGVAQYRAVEGAGVYKATPPEERARKGVASRNSKSKRTKGKG